jgi:hypothetical protein
MAAMTATQRRTRQFRRVLALSHSAEARAALGAGRLSSTADPQPPRMRRSFVDPGQRPEKTGGKSLSGGGFRAEKNFSGGEFRGEKSLSGLHRAMRSFEGRGRRTRDVASKRLGGGGFRDDGREHGGGTPGLPGDGGGSPSGSFGQVGSAQGMMRQLAGGTLPESALEKTPGWQERLAALLEEIRRGRSAG